MTASEQSSKTAIERLMDALHSENHAKKLRGYLSAQPVTLTDARLAADCIAFIRANYGPQGRWSWGDAAESHNEGDALAARIEAASE